MAPRRPLTYREVKRRREAADFVETSQKGSHVKFVKVTDLGVLTAIMLRHREIAVGTLRSILRQAQLSSEEFDRL